MRPSLQSRTFLQKSRLVSLISQPACRHLHSVVRDLISVLDIRHRTKASWAYQVVCVEQHAWLAVTSPVVNSARYMRAHRSLIGVIGRRHDP